MKKILIILIRFYQIFISPLTRGSCRFVPTCSHYSIQAIDKYGAIRGTILAIKRISKCHPLNPGGYDPIPEIDKKS